jgi:lipopolysaccharide/colanic/teichoic acid biosynthesis glycosyltransferase
MSSPRASSLSERRPSVIRAGNLEFGILPEDLFTRFLCVERKRTERSGRRFVLMLLDAGPLTSSGGRAQVANLLEAVARCTRDTDLKGWYRQNSIIGVIFTEIGDGEDKLVVHTLSRKLTDALYDTLALDEINAIRVSFHVFPEDWDGDGPDGPATSTLQVPLELEGKRRKIALGLKRMLDMMGSLAGIIVCLPALIAIAVAIKLTSEGPVLFRQVRLGRYGKKFTFLKFRSMYTNNDHTIHREYVKQFISGQSGTEQAGGNEEKVYKLTRDPRVTPLGRILRKTSMDELPQLFNVLKGDMSLVGPRPPVVYEFESYGLWHRRRLVAVKPGITGLWQVDGRSRVTFDEMVRLDIRYARSWSLWLDLKILMQTPRAVVSGTGAC